MESKTNKLIDNHPDELVDFIKIEVDNILMEYWTNFNILCDNDIRTDVILHTYDYVQKKYLNDTRFEYKKNIIVKYIILNYISKRYLPNQK